MTFSRAYFIRRLSYNQARNENGPSSIKYCCTLKYYCDGIFFVHLAANGASAEIPVLYRTGPGGVEREDTRVDLEYARRAGNSGRSAHTREWPGPEACGVTKELLLRKCKVSNEELLSI